MHPAAMRVEALVDEKLAPGDRAISVQSLFTDDLRLHAEIEGHMRIDIEHGASGGAARGGDRKSIGAGLRQLVDLRHTHSRHAQLVRPVLPLRPVYLRQAIGSS